MELVFEPSEIAHGGNRGVGLKFVVVDDDRDFRQPFVRDRLQRFPDLSFLQFAVTGHHHDPTAPIGRTLRARHPVRLRDPHAERAGVRRDERRRDVWMPRKATVAPQPV